MDNNWSLGITFFRSMIFLCFPYSKIYVPSFNSDFRMTSLKRTFTCADLFHLFMLLEDLIKRMDLLSRISDNCTRRLRQSEEEIKELQSVIRQVIDYTSTDGQELETHTLQNSPRMRHRQKLAHILVDYDDSSKATSQMVNKLLRTSRNQCISTVLEECDEPFTTTHATCSTTTLEPDDLDCQWLSHRNPTCHGKRLTKQDPDVYYSPVSQSWVCDYRKINQYKPSPYPDVFGPCRRPYADTKAFHRRLNAWFSRFSNIGRRQAPLRHSVDRNSGRMPVNKFANGVTKPSICTLCPNKSTHYLTKCKNLIWSVRPYQDSQVIRSLKTDCPKDRFCFAHDGRGSFCREQGHFSHLCPYYKYQVRNQAGHI